MDTRTTRTVAVNAEMDVNFDQEKMAAFDEAWATQRDFFYDPEISRRGLECGAEDDTRR